MAHLVAPLLTPMPVEEARTLVGDAHKFLVSAAAEATQHFSRLPENSEWGTAAKRVRVTLPVPRPSLVRDAKDEHSFAEIVNQCATMERLLATLHWARDIVGDCQVAVCHPTTSSQKDAEADDNDLILDIPDSETGRWHFEISDVASSKDGNRKELKDLRALDVLSSISPAKRSSKWPRGRRFLVVSEEFACRLMRPIRHLLKTGELMYQIAGCIGTTRIIEVSRGKAW